jgi:hypothetical protein
MYIPEILDSFELLGPLSLGTTAKSWAKDGCRRERFPRYPYIHDSNWFCVTSRTLPCRRRRSHPRQPYIRDSSGSSPNIAEMISYQTTESFATASYPLFRRVFASHHGYYVQRGYGAIRHSVISLILASVSVTYRKSRPCRRQLRFPTPSVRNAQCNVCNAYDTLGRERDPCVYNSEPHQTEGSE